MATPRQIITVIGAGGIGAAVARRLGSGRSIVLADVSEKTLDSVASSLRDDDHTVHTKLCDVSQFSSLQGLAAFAHGKGPIKTVVNTAGISSHMATARRIYEIDLVGSVNALDAFIDVVDEGATITSIASIAGHSFRPSISAALQAHFAGAPRAELLQHSELDLDGPTARAYGFSKLATIVRTQAVAASAAASSRGIRVNSVSPGPIMTPMARQALATGQASTISDIISASPLRRIGTVEDVADIVQFLASPKASFITGSDVVVDGGMVAKEFFGPGGDAVSEGLAKLREE